MKVILAGLCLINLICLEKAFFTKQAMLLTRNKFTVLRGSTLVARI